MQFDLRACIAQTLGAVGKASHDTNFVLLYSLKAGTVCAPPDEGMCGDGRVLV